MDFVRNSGEMDHISTVRIILRIEDGWIVLMCEIVAEAYSEALKGGGLISSVTEEE